MTQRDNGKVKFGVMEWVAIGTLGLMLLGQLGTSISWGWGQAERLTKVEDRQQGTDRALEEIKGNVELIPRIDERVKAIERAAVQDRAAAHRGP